MDTHVTESSYPLSFRQEDAQKLGEYLQQRHCVNLIGMKRVGISNFLRFFLTHPDIAQTYIDSKQKHAFITIDLNDLIEREIYPFWALTLKRIVDVCETLDLPEATKKSMGSLFLKGIQSQDLFLIIDTVRSVLSMLVEKGYLPTLFFLRFDRLQDAFSPSFFDNLAGLRTATHENLIYVFTSYRSLDSLFPSAKTSLSLFAQQMPMRPVHEKDMAVIYESYRERYNFDLPEALEKSLFSLVNGNVQYLQLALIILNEKKHESITSAKELLSLLLKDERITLESEELWDSLSSEEKKVLLKVAKGQKILESEKAKSGYLWDTGFILEEKSMQRVFSPLLEHYLLQIERQESKKNNIAHLTRKEHLLFTLLEQHLGEICEREKIIESVWPEYSEFGVSDWAIDRLVARVRLKLREQESPYEIITVRTRGYKLAPVKG